MLRRVVIIPGTANEGGEPMQKHSRYVVFCMQAVKTDETIDVRIIKTSLKREPNFPAQFPIQRTKPEGFMTESDAHYILNSFIGWISVIGTTRKGVPILFGYGNFDRDTVIHPAGSSGDVEGYVIGFSGIEAPKSGEWLVQAGRHPILIESKSLDDIGFWDFDKGHRLALLSLLDDIKVSLTGALAKAGHEVCFDERFEKLRRRLTYQ